MNRLFPPLTRGFARSFTKLNIGPGGNFRALGWTTLDHYLAKAHIKVDLRLSPKIPLADNSVSKVFCSHVIEHLDDAAVASLFRESRRILRPDGYFRVSCPDVARALEQHRQGLCDANAEVITGTMRDAPSHLRLLNVIASFRSPEYRGLRNAKKGAEYSGGPYAEREEVEENLARLSLQEFAGWVHGLTPSDATYRAHINAFWPEKVCSMLREAGFRDVRLSSFRASADEELRGEAFDNRPGISLFVEARPGGTGKTVLSEIQYFGRSLVRVARLWRQKLEQGS
jgi:SAM-dependent methyltransferase